MQKKSFTTILYSTVGVIVMAMILVAFNVVTSAVHQRVDLTKEQAYTLSRGTRAILGKLDAPIKIRFYCTQSESASPESVLLKSYARTIDDLLGEYKQNAHGKLTVERYDPQPDSDAEDSARLDGIQPQDLSGGEKFYLGLAVSQGLDEKQSIPFLSPDRERQLEYDISRAISRVVTPEKPVVGVMSPLPVFGTPANPMMAQMGQQPQQPWAIIGELKNDFTIQRVEMDADKIDDDVKVLLVIHPRDISDRAQYAIDQFVMRGGKLVAFLDAQSLVESRGQNPMMGGMSGGGSSLDKLLKAWGLQFDATKVVADRNLKMEMGEEGDTAREKPVWLALTPEDINSNDVTTVDLDSVWMFSSGAFTGTAAPGLKETVLLKSTTDSQLVDGMMANYAGESILKDFKPSGVSYALAVRLTGRFKTAFPGGEPEDRKKPGAAKPEAKADAKKTGDSLQETKQDTTVVLVGDSDMIYDGFTLQQIQVLPGVNAMKQMNANLNFAQNVVEQLAGDENLIAVRSRAILNRPFTRVKKMEAAAEAEYLVKIKELEDSRDQAMTRLNELQEQKNQNQRFIVSPEQQAEIENLRRKEAEINRELRKVNKELRREVVALQRRVEWANIAAVPLAVCAVGLGLAVYKRNRTSAT